MPKLVGSITLSRRPLCSPLALGDLETPRDTVLFYGTDQVLGGAITLFPVEPTGSSQEKLLLIAVLWPAFSDRTSLL